MTSTVQDGSDPLSQSLPAKSFKNLKKDTNDSVKCVYDSRLFKTSADDTEYLKENKMKKQDSFKDFLNASFNTERKTSKVKINHS